MIGTVNCVYETPCGWCSKWDKECDKRMYAKGHNQKNPQPINVLDESLINKMCESENDHEWECCGVSTAGSTYRCKKCFASKTIPIEYEEMSVTI